MSNRQPHRLRTSAAGALLGIVAMIVVSAILGGALSAFRASTTVDSLVGQLGAARREIDALRDDNTRLEEQNRQILEQNRTLVTYLRRHGLEIPQTATTPPPGTFEPLPSTTVPDADPKASTPSGPSPSPTRSPRPSAGPSRVPAAPAPTATLTPPAPGLEGLCDLTPILCHP